MRGPNLLPASSIAAIFTSPDRSLGPTTCTNPVDHLVLPLPETTNPRVRARMCPGIGTVSFDAGLGVALRR